MDTLSAKQALKAAWVINLVEEMDIVPTQYFQKMKNTDDLWEIRVKVGKNIFRFLGFFDGKQLVVLSHAFQKKLKRLPDRQFSLPRNANEHTSGEKRHE